MLSPIYAHIENYQSIADIDIEIKGFTTISGRTNIGKSAIIRAISGAILNSPVVGAVRKGAKFCSVSLKAKDWDFTWEKGDPKTGVNRYRFIKPEVKELKKVGQGQLDYVANLGFQSIQVGKKPIQPWLATQFEPLFLLNQSGPAITDFISNVSRLRVLQDAIVLNVRYKRRLLDEAKITEEKVEVLKEQEQKLTDIDILLRVSEELDAQKASITEYEQQIQLGKTLDHNLQWAANGIQTIRSISQAKIPEEITDTEFIELNEMRSLWNQLEAGAKQIIALNNITNVSVPEEPEGLAETANLTKVAELSDQIEQTKRRIAILSNDIPLPEPEEYPSGLSEAKSILSQIERLQAEETNLETALGATKKELEEVDIELAKIPVCKACNRPLLANHDHTLMA